MVPQRYCWGLFEDVFRFCCSMIFPEISDQVWSAARPGYDEGRNQPVALEVVDAWIARALEAEMRSILCLLDDFQLRLYTACPGGLLQRYRDAGFEVGHLPVADHQNPPLTEEQLRQAVELAATLAKPLLVHCSAGIGRTGAVLRRLEKEGEK